MITRSLAVLVALVALVAPALAQKEDRWNQLQADGMVALGQNRLADAEKLFAECLAIAESLDARLVAPSLNNLATLYYTERKYAEAEPLYRRAYTAMQTFPDADPLDVARTMNNLAICYAADQRYAEAEPLFAKALAALLKATGHASEANAMEERARAIAKKGR